MELKEIFKAIATFNWSALGKLLSYTWSGASSLHEIETHMVGVLPRASIWLCAVAAFLAAILAECYATPAGPFYLKALWEIVTKDGLKYVAKPMLIMAAAFGFTMLCIRARSRSIERWSNHSPLVRWCG